MTYLSSRQFRLTYFLLFTYLISSPLHIFAQRTWQVGELVALRAGTCIREGPGFGYRAHTRVPEDNWAVMVIDGPRSADGRTWYDTSRRAAGDPSGGTGWVDVSQSDLCPYDTQPTNPGNNTPDPVEEAIPTILTSVFELLRQVFDILLWGPNLSAWWETQTEPVRWAALILALMVLIWLWRRFGGYIFLAIEFYILGAFLWWISNATRELWEPTWWRMVGNDAPDLAVLIALFPAIYWVVARLTHLSYRARV